MKLKFTILFLSVLLLASCKEEKHNVLRNGRVVEVDGPMPPPPPPIPSKRIPPADGKYPEMTFVETEFDFGAIEPGDKVTHEFSFKNTGKADLLISDARGSCGCTVPEYPKEAIAPGAGGKITVTFNSAGKHGKQHKTVTLFTNTAKEREQLSIKTSINPGS